MEVAEPEGLASQLPDASAVNEFMHNEELTKGVECPASASTSMPLASNNNNGSTSNFTSHDDGNDWDDDMCEDDVDYDNNEEEEEEYMFDDDDDFHYLSMQAQFDNVELPAGVEASFPWMEEPPHTSPIATAITSPSQPSSGGTSMNVTSLPVGLQTECSASSSSTGQGSSVKCDEENGDGNQAIGKYLKFKRFDIVGDFSDHHYNNLGFQGQQPPKAWSKKVQDEWKMLEHDLPDTIYVRVYETRMDLLRAVIVGPQGTPYHDGLFVFDAIFPRTYPETPPMVYYYSGGLRLNPNLYDCGKVCLSLLNTWAGKGTEKWVPAKSTMLQVLVSIQALILNAKPFFNEPGFESAYVGREGEKRSNSYNENVFVLSLKTMIYTLRRPPMHFEDLVVGHFQAHAHDILSACKAYMDGAMIGSATKGETKDDKVIALDCGGCSEDFKKAISRMMNGLVTNFIKIGAKDCEKFRITS